jgi:serine O-acetyltransferase
VVGVQAKGIQLIEMAKGHAGTVRPVIASAATPQAAEPKPTEPKPAEPKPAEPKSAEWTITAPTAWDSSSFAGLRAILREDRQSTPEIAQEQPRSKVEVWLAPGSLALAVHRIGEWIKAGGPPRLLRRPATLLYTLLAGYVRSVLGFEIHRSVRLGRHVKFYHQNGVVIGGRCVIGDGCAIRHGVTIAPSPDNPNNPPQIGARVSFGVGCVVLGAVRIGDGAIIGPNAVVTTDVAPGATALAQPARVLRLR